MWAGYKLEEGNKEEEGGKMKRKIIEWLNKKERRIIELLIKWWMPQKDGKPLWKLARIRGPYRMKRATPEQVEERGRNW